VRERIAVVIPAYNRQATIERAIRSVLAQTYPPSEIVVVDDGSTDATAERARQTSSRVHVVTTRNQGPAGARNVGVEASNAEWIAFLDSDDYWSDDHLRAVVRAMQSSPSDIGLYFSDTVVAGPDGDSSYFAEAGFAPRSPYEVIPDATEVVLSAKQPTLLQSSVVSRGRFEEVGGLRPDLRIREDTHFFLCAGIGAPVVALPSTGCVMTSDVPAAQRVTGALAPAGLSYLAATASLYSDVLARFGPDLSPVQRDELQRREAHAHLRLARIYAKDRAIGRAVSAFRRVLSLDRSLVMETIRRRREGRRW